DPDLPALRPQEDGDHANERLLALLRVFGMPNGSPTKTRRLLRLLLLWVEPMPAPAKSRRMSRCAPRRRVASRCDRACRPPALASGGRGEEEDDQPRKPQLARPFHRLTAVR